MSEQKDNGFFIKHEYCIASELEGKNDCSSSDALALYEHDIEDGVQYSGFCWSCKQSFQNTDLCKSSLADSLGLDPEGVVQDRKEFERVTKQEPLTRTQVKDLIKDIGYKSNNYRGIRDEYRQFYGHLTKLDKFGNVIATYYPETEEGDLWPHGYKTRFHPKSWSKLGKTGINSQLSGQCKWSTGSRYLLITAGEEDKLAAFQMLRDDQINRGQGDYEPIHVVSGTCGESNLAKQVAKQYDWIDLHEIIVLCLDEDKTGKAAVEEVCKLLPPDKIKILKLSGGDPNNMLKKGKEKQFVREFYSAKDFQESGIISSLKADDNIEVELLNPKVKLPAFMQELEDKFAGGIPLGYWVNWIAQTGIGKSTTVNEAIREWIYKSPYKVGIVSLELTSAQYMIAMLSREVGYKINLIKSPQDAVEFVQQPHVMEARRKLRELDNGDERFALLDDREGSLENVKLQIIKLIRKHGCKLIVIDPLNDLFEASSWDEQSAFVKWMKVVVKEGIIFSCVCHVRKGGSSTDRDGKRIVRELTEDDVSGLSLITKSSGANIFLNRDKYAEDEIERNTTRATLGKCRWTGITGEAGTWYYDLKTHTMHDRDTYFSNGTDKLLEGF